MAIKKAARILTVEEYAKMANVSQMTVSHRMKNNKILPGISSYYFDSESWPRRYYLTRNSMPDEEIQKHFRSK